MIAAAGVIPLVIDTGRVLSLDMEVREKEVQQALWSLRCDDILSLISSL